MYRYPFTPYPNSWYRVALGADIKPGKLTSVRYFGRDLVIFRGADGAARVLDAHCPHLGAHLGHGGKIVGNTVKCPFHGWQFDGEGQCVSIPYCDKIPPKARMRSWPVREVNGIVFVWYHADGEAPQFDIPVMPEYGSRDWSSYMKLGWDIRIHIQEIAENALDLPHFAVVHSYLKIPTMSRFDVDGHTFRIQVGSPRRTMGFVSTTDIDITYHGLGVVYAKVKSAPVSLRVILTSTPIDEELLQVNMAVMYDRSWNPLRDAVMRMTLPWQIAKEFEFDIPVWENKVYQARPVLCAGDGQIMAIRRWAKQFYSEPATAAATAAPAGRVVLPLARTA